MRSKIFPVVVAVAALALPAAAGSTMEAYEAMGIDVGDVLNGTILSARVLAGEEKQTVAVVTYLTGKRGNRPSTHPRRRHGLLERLGHPC